jgi:hypothetical protein
MSDGICDRARRVATSGQTAERFGAYDQSSLMLLLHLFAFLREPIAHSLQWPPAPALPVPTQVQVASQLTPPDVPAQLPVYDPPPGHGTVQSP